MDDLTLRKSQYPIMKRLVRDGVIPFSVWHRWKQPALLGLWQRKMFTLNVKLDMTATVKGEEAVDAYRKESPEKRINFSRPVFRRVRRKYTARATKRKKRTGKGALILMENKAVSSL